MSKPSNADGPCCIRVMTDPCSFRLWLREVDTLQIRSLLITFLTYVAPGVSGALLGPAAWFLLLCPVRILTPCGAADLLRT